MALEGDYMVKMMTERSSFFFANFSPCWLPLQALCGIHTILEIASKMKTKIFLKYVILGGPILGNLHMAVSDMAIRPIWAIFIGRLMTNLWT